ncbi:hypothetical protein AcV7_009037 [Taiwanofungus camphoratus]|nr:hypothetical protein AcV7_009037 [Antrodia cinnamomea]
MFSTTVNADALRSCRHLQSYHQYFAAVTQGVVAALLIVRTYALYQRAKWVLVLLVSICLVGGTVSIWTIATGLKSTATKRVPMPTCDVSISVQEGHHLAIAWGAMLFFDVAVFLLTFMKAIWVGRVWKGTLFQVMIRDGTLYFGILVVLNVTNILTYVVLSVVILSSRTASSFATP